MSDKCYISVVLDRSGSMSSCQDATIKGFNDFLKDQKEAPGEATLTLVQFDDQYEVVHNNLDIKEVPNLSSKTFCPRGSTALLDAIGRTVNTSRQNIENMPEADRPSKVLFVIITDGAENASSEYDKDAVFKMVEDFKTKGWQFVFIGANQDAIKTAQSYGGATGSSLNYNASDAGTKAMYNTLSQSTRSFRCCAQSVISSPSYAFFDPNSQPANPVDLGSDITASGTNTDPLKSEVKP